MCDTPINLRARAKQRELIDQANPYYHGVAISSRPPSLEHPARLDRVRCNCQPHAAISPILL